MVEEKSALKFVLDFEKKGVNMYLELAAKTNNPLGKKLFYSLGSEEIAHARKADEAYSGFSSYESLALKTADALSVEQVLKEYFKKMTGTKFKKGGENTEAYELAMDMERKGYETYDSFLKNAKTDQEKAFFKWILHEESEHLAAIANVYAYLTGTGDWLEEDESRTWNWMNL